jgi:hypothetical protein
MQLGLLVSDGVLKRGHMISDGHYGAYGLMIDIKGKSMDKYLGLYPRKALEYEHR